MPIATSSIQPKPKPHSKPTAHIARTPSTILPNGATGFAAAANVLLKAFEEKAKGRILRDPRNGSRQARGVGVNEGMGGKGWDPVPQEQLFIVSWVDYCHKVCR